MRIKLELTMQILQELKTTLNTDDIGVVLKANHSCISCQGVEDLGSSTITSVFQGEIKKDVGLKGVLFNT